MSNARSVVLDAGSSTAGHVPRSAMATMQAVTGLAERGSAESALTVYLGTAPRLPRTTRAARPGSQSSFETAFGGPPSDSKRTTRHMPVRRRYEPTIGRRKRHRAVCRQGIEGGLPGF